MRVALLLASACLLQGGLYSAQAEFESSARLVITAEAHKGQPAPTLAAGDVSVNQGKDRLKVTGLYPLRGEHAGLQFAILIDDGADQDLSLQFGDLRKFIESQPATTQFGVFYMRNGSAMAVHKMSADHEAAAKSFRIPLGEPGIAGDPYDALKDLVKTWPRSGDRREVLMISSGVGLFRGLPSNNPYLGSAIDECQRAGVQVHSIYFGGSGHSGHSSYLINFGRDSLSYLGDETGGEAYWLGLSTATSFQGYLKDLSERLENQYLVTFQATPGKKPELVPVKLKTEVSHVEVIAADKVFLPGTR